MREFARIMIKYGFSGSIRALRLGKSVPGIRSLLSRRGSAEVPDGLSKWELLRLALEELGPTFVKLGQLLSTRSDILPEELLTQFSRLQDSVQPVEWPRIREALHAELGNEITNVFARIDEYPTGSASIAQVHRGVLVTGEEVAVKIQRPGIPGTIEIDLDIMDQVARLAERHLPIVRHFHPSDLMKEFRKHILQELDFGRERRNMERFRANHAKRYGIYVPETYAEYCTHRLIVMEFVDGVKLSALDSEGFHKKLPDCDPSVIARRGADLTLEQILIHGFFHADPHPGNIMILPGNVLCFLDFGMMGELRETERNQMAAAVLGIAQQDGRRVADALVRLSNQNRTVQYDTLVDEVQVLVQDYLDRPLKDLDIGELFADLVRLVTTHGIHVPASLLMVVKALLTTEGVGVRIYPEFTLQPALRAVARKLMIEQLRPNRMAKLGSATMMEYLQLLRDLPGDTGDVLRQLRAGRLVIGFRMRGLEPLRRTLDNISYRLIFGIVLAALMISSALIIQAKIPPLWNGIPLIGVVGFVIAGVLSLSFLVSLISHVFRRDR